MRARLAVALAAFLLASCARAPVPTLPREGWALETFPLREPPSIGRTAGGQELRLGGFSGLFFLGSAPGGELRFATLTDRGPNAEKLSIAGLGHGLRPFLLPGFQPRILLFRSDRGGGRIVVEESIGLKDFAGRPLSGLPNLTEGKEARDEPPVDMAGAALPPDPLGVDTEGLTRDDDGNWWACEEYRPSLLKFSRDGTLLRRYVPEGSYSPAQMEEFRARWGEGRVVQSLPAWLKSRKRNNGFEGVTFAGGWILAAVQGPLELPGDEVLRARWVQVNPRTGAAEAELAYPLEKGGPDKIGDISASPEGVLVIEQSSKAFPEQGAVHDVFLVEGLPLKAPGPGLRPLVKRRIARLAEAGYSSYPKVEGVASLPGGRIAVVNDNDFGLRGELDLKRRRIALDPSLDTVLGILSPVSRSPGAAKVGETGSAPAPGRDPAHDAFRGPGL